MGIPMILAQGLARVTMIHGLEFTEYNPKSNDTDLTWKGIKLRVSFSHGISAENIPARFFVEERTDHGTLLSGGEVQTELETLLNNELPNIIL